VTLEIRGKLRGNLECGSAQHSFLKCFVWLALNQSITLNNVPQTTIHHYTNFAGTSRHPGKIVFRRRVLKKKNVDLIAQVKAL
jgi:hypothetical protein